MSWQVPVERQTKLQIEMSNYCNAACPACARAFINDKLIDMDYHFDVNSMYVSLEQFKSWVSKDKWTDLRLIHMCGNYDEATTNPDLIEIVKWILSNDELFTSKPKISIATNGGTRNDEFWTTLGEISKESNGRVRVNWGLDGLEDTNHIYRVNVDWQKVQRNFRNYIAAGGDAVWQFIYFSHNEHQAHLIEDIAAKEGFSRVKFIGSPRADLGKNSQHKSDPKVEKKQEVPTVIPRCISSKIEDQGLYVTHHGYVVPCCWWGTKSGFRGLWQHYSKDHGTEHHRLNGQNSIQDIFDSEWYTNLYTGIKDGIFPKCIENCKENKVATQRFEALK